MSQPDINHHSRPSSSSSSSLRHRNTDDVDDQKDSSKRYATYELNWRDDHDYISINSTDDRSQNNDTSTNSAQAARWSLPPKTPPPTIPLPPVPQQQHIDQRKSTSRHSKKPIAINTTRRPEPRDKRESEPQSPFGGITITTVKVVEILHSPTEKDENNKSKQRNSEPLNLSNAVPVGIITSEHKRRNHVLSHPLHPSTPRSSPQKQRLRMNEDPKMSNQQKKRSSIINPQKIKSNKRKSTNKPEMIIPKEMAFIDARLLAHKSLVRTQTNQTNRNRNRKQIKRGGGSVHKKRSPPKNFEFGPTSNPIYSNDPTDMEADLPPIKHQMYPWLPHSHKPPKLLHASLVPLPQKVNVTNPNHDFTTKNNDIRNNNSSINVSRIFSSVNPKRKSKVSSSNNRLSRANSQRRRASIISQDPNRASLIFRRQILEESLAMSFNGMLMGGAGGVGIHQPQPVSKPPIRRKTKKGSNAKVEDRETRRERRRKEKLEKKLAENAQDNVASDNNNNNNNVNDQIEVKNNIENENGEEKVSERLEINRTIEQPEVEKEIYMGPQPPPRKPPQDATIIDDSPQPQKPKNSTLSLFASPPERGLSLEPLADEPPPFPAHLARSTLLFEHNSNKEKSKHKQSPYSPPIGPSSSSPISSVSNHSRLMPSPLEGNELFKEEESRHDITNSEETNTTQLSPSIKPSKIGMNILGFFNKQTTKDSTSPPLSRISSPPLLPTQLSQSKTTPAPLTLSIARTPPSTPTSSTHNQSQSPPLSPLSPSRALRLPQQLSRVGKSRRGTENVPSSPPAVQDPEKLRKMEQFEALIASSEPSSSKKPITEKIKAFTTAITTVASTATSSASSTSNASLEKRKKSAEVTPYNTPRHSSETNLSGRRGSDQKNRDSSSNNSFVSFAESIYHRSEEKSELGKPGDDGVIRVTLTPAVCR